MLAPVAVAPWEYETINALGPTSSEAKGGRPWTVVVGQIYGPLHLTCAAPHHAPGAHNKDGQCQFNGQLRSSWMNVAGRHRKMIYLVPN